MIDAPATGVARQPPEVSVIIPLIAHRGIAIECVDGWVRGQTYPRDRFEVIIATNGAEPEMESLVKGLLGSRDRVICSPTNSMFLLYNVAVQEARARLLFITESHCIPEPDCLQEMMNYLATHDVDGASCRGTYICPNAIARMEGRFYEAGLRDILHHDDWRKVTLRGFAIYSDIFLKVGGFEHEFGFFAGWALAAKFHVLGYRFGYATRATVRHLNGTRLRELRFLTGGLARDECAYRASTPAEYCERYFGYAEEWAQRGSLRRSVALALCRATWQGLLDGVLAAGSWSMVRAQAGALLRLLPVALFGARWRLVGSRWWLWMAMARCWLWRASDERLYRAYRDTSDRIIRCGRLEYIAEYLAASAPTPPETYVYRLSEIQKEWLVGFHAVEHWESESFRWSGPVSMVRVGLPMGSYDVQIETRSLRKAPVPLYLRVFFNRHKVPSSSIQFDNGLLSFRVPPSMFEHGPEQRLILTCNPLRPWKSGVPDRRELGLPILSITFTPVEESGSGRDEVSVPISHQPSVACKTT